MALDLSINRRPAYLCRCSWYRTTLLFLSNCWLGFLLVSTGLGLKIQTQHRRLYTGEPAAANAGIDIQSPAIATIHFENGFFTIAGTQYTRTALLLAAKAGTLSFQGVSVRESANSDGAVIFELLPYLIRVQMTFWNDRGNAFFNVFVHIPNTLTQDPALCQHGSTCPTTGAQNPLNNWIENMFMSTTEYYETGVFGMRTLADPVITAEMIEAACGPLKILSEFYYNACVYDVPGSKNPNIANVIIGSLNTIVTILKDENVLQNFTALLNVTAGTFNNIPINTIVPGFPTITTDDQGNPTLGLASSTAPNMVLLGAFLFSYLIFRRT